MATNTKHFPSRPSRLTKPQQDAVSTLYRGLDSSAKKRPSKEEVHAAWKRLNASTTSFIQRAILDQLHTALTQTRPEQWPDLLAVLGSWGDTLPDEEIKQYLRVLNTKGRIIEEHPQLQLESAIRDHVRVRFQYEGKKVAADPHAIGLTRTGLVALRAYRTGERASGNLFAVSKISNLEITAEKFSARKNYSANRDPVMLEVWASVRDE